MASGYKVTALVLFSLAAICLVATVALYFIWHIRQVRDTLTGKTAERRIAQLRSVSGRWQTTKSRVGVGGSALEEPWNAKDIDRALGFSSLGIAGSGRTDMPQVDAAEDKDDALGTTLLGDDGGETHLNLDAEHVTKPMQPQDFQTDSDDEQETNISLSSGERKFDEDDERDTTLLGKDRQ